jgi:hypothetical protein
MSFSKRARRQQEPVKGSWLGRFTGRLIRDCLRLTFGTAVILVVVAGLLYLRLSQGPIHLSYAAQIAAQVFNSDSDLLEVELEDLVLTLGDAKDGAGGLARVQFVGFQVRQSDGTPLFAIPRLSARFDTTDLLQGHLRPTRIVLIRPEARVLRTRDGRFQFGLGTQSLADESDNGASAESPIGATAQVEAISRILNGFVGDAEPIPELSRLTEIVIYGADLTYENVAAGRSWQTRRADLRVYSTDAGLSARMSIGLADGAETGAGVVVNAERHRGGGGATRLDVRFDDLRPEHLAEQLDQMQWLRLFDAPLDGNLQATVQADGRIEGLAGRISAGAGRILALEEKGQPFDSVALAFAYEAGLERMQVSEVSLASRALDTRLSGFVDLDRGADGEVTGLAAQFEVRDIRAAVPDVFARELHFDGGQIVARLNFDPMRIEVAEARLQNGDLVIDVSGRASAAPDGWHTDLRASGRNMSVEQLVQHWPLVAAVNARKWVDKNIHAGGIDAFVAHMRFGNGDPLVNLDFRFSGLMTSYLHDMTPIRGARGRGSLTLDELHLAVEAGEVEPVKGSPVRLDGSVIRLLDLQSKPSLAKITIRAEGETSSILTLIDEEPLALMGKLGLDPATIEGRATVVAEVGFPLIKELQLDEVEVVANADLAGLRLPFRLPGGQLLDIASQAVHLRADKRELSLSGPIQADGSPLVLDWNEYYGRGSNNRTVALKGAATPALLKRLDLDTEYFTDGQAQVDLLLSQTGSPDYAFDLTADLGPARLAVADFAWSKAPGVNAALEATGLFGDDIRVSRFRLDAGDLKAAGAVDFARGGQMKAARIERMQFRGLADMAIVANRQGGGELSLKVSGNRLDLALFDDAPGGGAPGNDAGTSGTASPLTVDYDLRELGVTPKVIARPARGTYRRNAGGDAAATLEGQLAGKVPFTAEYEKTGGEAAEIVVRSDDAGALLKAAELFRGAEGGRLKLKARIAPEAGTEIVGVAKIKDVRISGASTFKSMLDEGDVKDAASAVEGEGLAFDKVKVPFEYRDGVLILGESVAKGNLLAVKVEGTVDENSNEVDLVGVISPAYALTGVVDNIPLLGVILSGGKGEGILAMTFKVRGTLDEPDFSVNPLSLLAPGFLRNIFSGRAASPNEKFTERLSREID